MVQLGFVFLYFGILILIKFLSELPRKRKSSSKLHGKYQRIGAGSTVLWVVLFNSEGINYITTPFGVMFLLMFVPVVIVGLIIPAINQPKPYGHKITIAQSNQNNPVLTSRSPDRDNHYWQIDSLLNTLSDDERAYLERKLGAGELVLSDDGELVTLEEHRRGKRNKQN